MTLAPEAAPQDNTTCLGREPTLVGTAGDDRLTGTAGADVILGLAGDDVINGLGGGDVVCGGEGEDILLGGVGADTLLDESATFDEDVLIGGGGDDRLFGELGDDFLTGGPGNDELSGGEGDDEDLAPGKDVLSGGAGADSLAGGPGHDVLLGGEGADALMGGDDVDRLQGGFGADRLFGESGDDELEGSSGADQVAGEDGSDHVLGGPGPDELLGGPGNDELAGGPGADRLAGGEGEDVLFGGPGDDVLDGGSGRDTLDGGPGNDVLIDVSSLGFLVDAGVRDWIRSWAADRTIANINAEFAALDRERRDRLAEVVLATNATGEDRARLLQAMRTILADADLGFYAEIWSYTFVDLTPGGFFGTCNRIFLDPPAFAGLSELDARNVLAHESFHSFNCVNGGPVGSLDEGSALWVIPVGFGDPLLPGQSWAEATYGSKLFHKVFFGNPNLPLVAPLNPSAKLLEVYQWLAAHDSSRLPWNSTERLVDCFDRYFADLNRAVDYLTEWLPAVDQATQQMLADPECRPV